MAPSNRAEQGGSADGRVESVAEMSQMRQRDGAAGKAQRRRALPGVFSISRVPGYPRSPGGEARRRPERASIRLPPAGEHGPHLRGAHGCDRGRAHCHRTWPRGWSLGAVRRGCVGAGGPLHLHGNSHSTRSREQPGHSSGGFGPSGSVPSIRIHTCDPVARACVLRLLAAEPPHASPAHALAAIEDQPARLQGMSQ
jgi:hypothetical protein